MPTTCQLATVTITTDFAPEIRFEVPAYTRSHDDLAPIILDALSDYLSLSALDQKGMSIADFALRLLAIAANDPREVTP